MAFVTTAQWPRDSAAAPLLRSFFPTAFFPLLALTASRLSVFARQLRLRDIPAPQKFRPFPCDP